MFRSLLLSASVSYTVVLSYILYSLIFLHQIKKSADLRNNYNEISTFCHNYPEPVFITKNGKGDLAVMSIEAYEEMTSRFELYSQIKE